MPTALDLDADVVELTRQLVDVESVSGNEGGLADLIEQALRPLSHLELVRDQNVLVARTEVGASERVVIAGHIDTVPLADNLPSWLQDEGSEQEKVYGRGSCDMKGGVAVQLAVAAGCPAPARDVTWVFYDNEEVEAERNGLNRIARTRPELLAGDFAVLCEPSGAGIEGGCQGTMRVVVELTGLAAHSARSWMGRNAIHAATPVLQRLVDYTPREVEVEGLVYHEGLNAVDIRGGIAGNVVPDRCRVAINYRFAPDRDAAGAEAHLREVFDGFELEVVDAAEGARPGLDQPAAQEFLAAVGGTPRAKFGWTDVARFSAMGIPAVNFGPGDPSKAHADDEFCPSADIRACRDALQRWLQG